MLKGMIENLKWLANINVLACYDFLGVFIEQHLGSFRSPALAHKFECLAEFERSLIQIMGIRSNDMHNISIHKLFSNRFDLTAEHAEQTSGSDLQHSAVINKIERFGRIADNGAVAFRMCNNGRIFFGKKIEKSRFNGTRYHAHGKFNEKVAAIFRQGGHAPLKVKIGLNV